MRNPYHPSERQHTSGSVCVWAGVSVVALSLCGCAAGIVADVVSVGMSGKSIADHGLDLITGNTCNLFQSIFRADHVVCEPRGLAAPTRDGTELSHTGHSPEAPPAFADVAPSDGLGSVGPGLNGGDPGGLSGSETY